MFNTALDMFARLGVSSATAASLEPYLHFIPAHTKPGSYAQSAMYEAVQYGLREAGWPVKVGEEVYPGSATETGLKKVAGANWKVQPWYAVFKRVIQAMDAKALESADSEAAQRIFAQDDIKQRIKLDNLAQVKIALGDSDSMSSKLPYLIGGAIALIYLLRRK